MEREDWKFCPLGEIAEVTTGGTPSRTNASFWLGGDIPWARTTEVQNCIIRSADIEEHITQEGLKNSSAKLVPQNAILLALIGQGKTRGQVALLADEAAINQNCAAIILKRGHSPVFYFNYLRSQYQRIRRLSNSAGQSNLNGTLVKSLIVPVPPPNEQTAIADILLTWDRAIETVDKLTKNSEAQQRALMQTLLSGKKRLPGFEGDWKTSRIDEVATRVTLRNDGGDHPILTISSTAGFISQKDKYSRYMAGKSVENYIVLKRGEFAYNKGNSKTYQFGCVFDLDTFDAALVPHVYVCFRLNPGMNLKFFRYLFAIDYLRAQLGQLVNTGVRNNGLLNITPAQFLATTVPVPPVDEQEAISEVLSVATSRTAALRRNLSALHEERTALMQQLLTGRRRVKVSSTPNLLAAIG